MIDRLDPSLARLDRSAFELVFAEDFTAAALHADRWSATTCRTGPRPSAQRPATPSTTAACGCSSMSDQPAGHHDLAASGTATGRAGQEAGPRRPEKGRRAVQGAA